MAEQNNGDYFDDQTKSRYFDECLDLFRCFFEGTGELTGEESRRLVIERDDACVHFYDREIYTPIPPDDFCFNGVCNLEESRSMFERVVQPTYELHSIRGPNSNNNNYFPPTDERNDKGLDNQLNLGQTSVSGDCQGASASAASKLPEPSSFNRKRFVYTMDVDKKFKLVIHNSKTSIQGKNTGSVQVKCRKKTGEIFRITLTKSSELGAKVQQIDMIYLTNDQTDAMCSDGVKPDKTNKQTKQLQVKKSEVLKITDADCFMDELFIRGQCGAFEDKEGLRKTKGCKDTYARLIQCGIAIFKIDFYDFYVYNIVGIVCDPDKSLASQWPWLESGKPVDPPYNNKTKYSDLIGKIKTLDDRDEFVKIFKLLNTGDFCNFTSSNKPVMQLCLALSFSEVIRYFKCLEWNQKLVDRLDYIGTATKLRKVLELHPMNITGSFEGRLTGYNGRTDAAECRVLGFNAELELRKRTHG